MLLRYGRRMAYLEASPVFSLFEKRFLFFRRPPEGSELAKKIDAISSESAQRTREQITSVVDRVDESSDASTEELVQSRAKGLSRETSNLEATNDLLNKEIHKTEHRIGAHQKDLSDDASNDEIGEQVNARKKEEARLEKVSTEDKEKEVKKRTEVIIRDVVEKARKRYKTEDLQSKAGNAREIKNLLNNLGENGESFHQIIFKNREKDLKKAFAVIINTSEFPEARRATDEILKIALNKNNFLEDMKKKGSDTSGAKGDGLWDKALTNLILSIVSPIGAP